MFWLLLATGFTGGLTLVFLMRRFWHWWSPPPELTSHFSPKGGCTDVVIGELQAARHEVLVLAYSFSSKPIAQALIDAKLRGVHVEVILDHSNEHESYTELQFLQEQGLAPLIDAEHAIAHNKVMVLDRKTVLTGSFNFTHQAEAENAENLLVIKGYPALSRAYRDDFFKHKEHARAPQAVPAGKSASATHFGHGRDTAPAGLPPTTKAA
jgi:phosphatidylserine/phosphatidylglycerophosphate/cardiolipin synthase-like enzyme